MAIGDLFIAPIRIEKLRSKIVDGEIKIPPFQRDFVWKPQQIIDLLDSIVNDYPIGSILLWETNYNLSAKRNVGGYRLPESKADYPINYVLDGQQRITSIFSVFSYGLEYDNPDPNINLDIHYDIVSKQFASKKDIVDINKALPLKLLFDNHNYNSFIRKQNYTEAETIQIDDLQKIFLNYEIPTVTIKKRSKSEVGVIFERINNTGTPLVTLDLMVAWTWMEDFHLKEQFKTIYDSLKNKNFGKLKDKILLQCLSAILQRTTKTSEILKLNPNLVRNSIVLLKKSLDKAIDYISTQFNAKSEDFLPKAQQIVALTYFFSKARSPTLAQANIIQNWFWRTSFSDRYSASTDSKMDEDILFMDEILLDNFAGISKYSSQINEDTLIKQAFSKSNPYVRAILLLLSKVSPLDLTNGQKIDTGESLSDYNKKEYHHIFPNAYLKGLSKSTSEINSICNFCFLPASSNKVISNKPPSIYFKSIIPQNHFNEILDSNLIPKRLSIYENDDYQEFLQERAKIILQQIRISTND
jgi:hypothetical protein